MYKIAISCKIDAFDKNFAGIFAFAERPSTSATLNMGKPFDKTGLKMTKEVGAYYDYNLSIYSIKESCMSTQ